MPMDIEGFVVDGGFTDKSKLINGILTDENVKVAALNSKALSYFSKPSVYQDNRDATSRVVNWTAETKPAVVFDLDLFSYFTETMNEQDPIVSAGFFKIIDKLLFNYNANLTPEFIEADLLADSDVASIYVPDSVELSATIVEDQVYYLSGTTATVGVPTRVRFSITVPVGQTTETFVIRLFAHVPTWLTGYSFSTIVSVVPPLPYDQLYSAPLTNSTDSIFSTARVTATLSYNTTQAQIGTVSISGITEFNAVLVDSVGNTVSVPFNILFKGRRPTLPEIRQAIRDALTASGVGTEAGWEARIPGVFVAGRFYLVPMWDQTITKSNQVLYPSILPYQTIGERVGDILQSTGFGEVTEFTDVLTVYYNRMTIVSVPDQTGILDIAPVISLIPDYQNFAPTDENYASDMYA